MLYLASPMDGRARGPGPQDKGRVSWESTISKGCLEFPSGVESLRTGSRFLQHLLPVADFWKHGARFAAFQQTPRIGCHAGQGCLFWTCHDERFLYMLMEFVPGGELFSYLRNRGRFSSNAGLFYSAEIICAIEYLHSREIVYRDLKPENILLDRDGHIKLTDFGFAKKLVDKTWTLCGTPEYLAPEVIQSKGHGRAVDWWALGILIFEMLSGFPPFFDDNPFGIYQKILAGKIDFPRHLDFNVKDLIKKLLVVDRTRRLGNMKNGADDVKRHRWFRTVDWEAVPQRKLKPPIVPKVCGEGDTSNFEAYPENDWNTAPPVSPKDLEVFKNF
uniref:Protein kinase cAMP-dependent X-linked catalytic subunit n=1 Tax=Rhinolophus ferrumequinum TaxID=59479 RepID=A0A671DXV5_RHIFE